MIRPPPGSTLFPSPTLSRSQAPTASVTINDGDGYISAAEAGSIGFTVAGLDADATAVVTFSDGTSQVTANVARSGEHTSELQTPCNLAFPPLLAVNDTAGNT